MKTILITGSDGQLGSELKRKADNLSNCKLIFTDYNTLDISNSEQMNFFFENNEIDYLVNCAAYTAVDKAETETDKAFMINAHAVKLIGYLCNKFKTKLIHISTDYVFEGTHYLPYTETDATNPISQYGKSKLEGELLLHKTNCRAIIIRTAWLYSAYGNNFVKTILRLADERETLNVVYDQIGTPTHAADLAQAIIDIIGYSETTKNFDSKTYHFANEGVCSWYDFATEIVKLAKLKCKINPIETKDYPTPAKRPIFSVLNKEKIKKTFSLEIPHWTKSLEICLTELLYNKKKS